MHSLVHCLLGPPRLLITIMIISGYLCYHKHACPLIFRVRHFWLHSYEQCCCQDLLIQFSDRNLISRITCKIAHTCQSTKCKRCAKSHRVPNRGAERKLKYEQSVGQVTLPLFFSVFGPKLCGHTWTWTLSLSWSYRLTFKLLQTPEPGGTETIRSSLSTHTRFKK